MASDRLGYDQPSWFVRRTLVIATLVFCCVATVYLMVWAESDELRETIANGILFLAGSVLMAYVFGAVWQDVSVFRSRSQSAYDAYPYDPYARVTPDNPDRL